MNFFGTIAVTKAALPHLRASGGRLITVGSAYGIVGQPFNEPYCAAKAAVEAYLESLAPVLAGVGVTVSVVEPGPVASRHSGRTSGWDRSAILAAAGPYASAFETYLGQIAQMVADEAPGEQITVTPQPARGRIRRHAVPGRQGGWPPATTNTRCRRTPRALRTRRCS